MTTAETLPDMDYFGLEIKREKGSVEMKYTDSITYIRTVGPN